MQKLNKVIVTGASGPLGIFTVQECLHRGMFVMAVVRPNSSRATRLPKHSSLRIVEGDMQNLTLMNSLASNSEVADYDACIHLAWMYTDSEGRNNPCLQAKNIPATLEVAEFSRRMGCRIIVAAGSQAEYGELNGIADEDTPINPYTPYGMAKFGTMHLLMEYGRQNNLRVNWVRVFSTYGPYENDYVMTSYLIRSLLGGNKPSLTPCEQIWDFLYAADAAGAFVDVAEKAPASGVYCLGSGEAKPLKEYIVQIRDAIDPKLPLGIGERPYGKKQIMHLEANIGKLQREVGFSPQTKFSVGIKKLITWYREGAK